MIGLSRRLGDAEDLKALTEAQGHKDVAPAAQPRFTRYASLHGRPVGLMAATRLGFSMPPCLCERKTDQAPTPA